MYCGTDISERTFVYKGISDDYLSHQTTQLLNSTKLQHSDNMVGILNRSNSMITPL